MKAYEKPEIEITEFRVSDDIAAQDSGIWDPFLDMSGDDIFLGEEEGYVVG